LARIEGEYEQAWLAATTALGSSATPWGACQLDLTQAEAQGLVRLQGGVAQHTLPLPQAAASVGVAIHMQAGFLDEGVPVGALTNRVSFRIQP
jgi:hypothetical protein